MTNFNNIVVFGIARNCGKYIRQDIERLNRALDDWDSVKYFVVESDSTDNTIEQLKILEKELKEFRFTSLGMLEATIPKRTERVAFCRNKYLEELENNEIYKNTEYVLVTDLDGTNELITKEAIASCWEIEDWGVCTANQFGVYYDLWAFRHPLFAPNDHRDVYKFMVNELGVKPRVAEKKAIKSRMFWYPKKMKPLEVDSAFGGLAIYKREVLKDAKYVGIDENGEQVCEHVHLNMQIREKGYKIYLNPRLINCTPPTQYVKSRLKKFLIELRKRYYFLVKD